MHLTIRGRSIWSEGCYVLRASLDAHGKGVAGKQTSELTYRQSSLRLLRETGEYF